MKVVKKNCIPGKIHLNSRPIKSREGSNALRCKPFLKFYNLKGVCTSVLDRSRIKMDLCWCNQICIFFIVLCQNLHRYCVPLRPSSNFMDPYCICFASILHPISTFLESLFHRMLFSSSQAFQ